MADTSEDLARGHVLALRTALIAELRYRCNEEDGVKGFCGEGFCGEGVAVAFDAASTFLGLPNSDEAGVPAEICPVRKPTIRFDGADIVVTDGESSEPRTYPCDLMATAAEDYAVALGHWRAALHEE